MSLPQKDGRHVFVALPLEKSFQDVYHFGIADAVRECGCTCERVDKTHFTGDTVQRIEDRIRTATLVIADVTGGRPNVYFEAGYASGGGVPVVFIAKEGEELHFDICTQACLFYSTITQLRGELEALIRSLFSSGDDSPR
ncbi:MAG: hypothetical protein ABIP48_27940 [Planctomycetota bacterium]